jgi:hypothetical protein
MTPKARNHHMTDTLDAPTLTAAGDPVAPPANPLILNSAYFELSGTNLSCTVKHLEAGFPENKLVTASSFCGEVDYVGATKYHLRATFNQDFTASSVFATLTAAYQAFVAGNTPVAWKARPYSSRIASATNPIISGLAIPQPFMPMGGDAGAISEVVIDWNLTGPPTIDNGSVAATGATAGSPGYFTPTGATAPANLAALTGITASPTTAWAVGQYVITADLVANHWSSSAWVAGKA